MVHIRFTFLRFKTFMLILFFIKCSFFGAPAMAHSFLVEKNTDIVTDRISGTAIMGYDPVAYFTENAAVLGSARFEVEWNGVIWRFANAANKAAFEGAPHIYAPINGGYDPVGMGRGRKIPGNPFIFAVEGQHVYLFVSRQNRNEFLAKREHASSEKHHAPDETVGLYVHANGQHVSLTKENAGVLLSAIREQ